MFTPSFAIFCRNVDGSEFRAFTWCRDEANGIADDGAFVTGTILGIDETVSSD